MNYTAKVNSSTPQNNVKIYKKRLKQPNPKGRNSAPIGFTKLFEYNIINYCLQP